MSTNRLVWARLGLILMLVVGAALLGWWMRWTIAVVQPENGAFVRDANLRVELALSREWPVEVHIFAPGDSTEEGVPWFINPEDMTASSDSVGVFSAEVPLRPSGEDPSPDGPYRLTFSGSKGWATSSEVEVTLDRVPPQLDLTLPTGERGVFAATHVDVSGRARDLGEGGIRAVVIGGDTISVGAQGAFDRQWTVPADARDEVTLVVSAIDLAGNSVSTTRTLPVYDAWQAWNQGQIHAAYHLWQEYREPDSDLAKTIDRARRFVENWDAVVAATEGLSLDAGGVGEKVLQSLSALEKMEGSLPAPAVVRVDSLGQRIRLVAAMAPLLAPALECRDRLAVEEIDPLLQIDLPACLQAKGSLERAAAEQPLLSEAETQRIQELLQAIGTLAERTAYLQKASAEAAALRFDAAFRELDLIVDPPAFIQEYVCGLWDRRLDVLQSDPDLICQDIHLRLCRPAPPCAHIQSFCADACPPAPCEDCCLDENCREHWGCDCVAILAALESPPGPGKDEVDEPCPDSPPEIQTLCRLEFAQRISDIPGAVAAIPRTDDCYEAAQLFGARIEATRVDPDQMDLARLRAYCNEIFRLGSGHFFYYLYSGVQHVNEGRRRSPVEDAARRQDFRMAIEDLETAWALRQEADSRFLPCYVPRGNPDCNKVRVLYYLAEANRRLWRLETAGGAPPSAAVSALRERALGAYKLVIQHQPTCPQLGEYPGLAQYGIDELTKEESQ